ncbi:MAG: PqqD family protein [Myxococcota bacterium]|nr:PqqD family protein [Myxococcota bacterium]
MRIPKLHPDLKLRPHEAIAYDRRRSQIFEFNSTGEAILRLVDGQADEATIAASLAKQEQEDPASCLEICRHFLEQCAAADLIAWSQATPPANSTKVPMLKRRFRIRKDEPIGYCGSRSQIFHFNSTAYQILLAVNGERNIRAIAMRLAKGNSAHATDKLQECLIFLHKCEQQDLIEWRCS